MNLQKQEFNKSIDQVYNQLKQYALKTEIQEIKDYLPTILDKFQNYY